MSESIKMVASQLLQSSKNPPPATGEGSSIVEDVRTPPKMKTQQANKNKPKVSTTARPQIVENSHAGIALPVTSEDLEKESNSVQQKNSSNLNLQMKVPSTTEEGISTWILLSGNPTTVSSPIFKNQNKKVTPEIKVKVEDNSSKENAKPQNKPKPKTTVKPTRSSTIAPKPLFNRRPVTIGSPNKADLIASGSAVNENVMNKIKASVLANVQKNKSAAMNRTTTTTVKPSAATVTNKIKNNEISTTVASVSTTKKQDVAKKEKKTPTAEIVLKINKPQSNKVKKPTTEVTPIKTVSNMIESKETEFELEVSTPPPATTKKPKRTSNKRKKNKNRRRKPATSTVKPDIEEAESKINNSTKLASKVPPKDKPITTQIYNYLSREVMPSVGVGLVSLAGIVGLASYFLYPFSNVVRRAYDTNDRKDDLYYQNGESYATDDGGQSEEEMLGKVLAGMPDNNRNLDPYIGQTQFKYPQVKPQQDQNVRYRNVAYGSEVNSYLPSDRVGQHSPENIQGAAYSEHIQYDTHIPDDKDVYSQPLYQPLQPVYQSQEQSIHDTGYASDLAYASHEKMSDPVYGQAMRYSQEIFAETTKAPTMETLHLGVDDIIEKQKETGYTVAATDESKQPQFVVGNVPQELIQAVTPVTVPEHGPRSLRIRRSVEDIPLARSVTGDLEMVLRKERENVTDPDLLNEIDEALGLPVDKWSKKPIYSSDKYSDKLEMKTATKAPLDLKVVDSKKEAVYTVLPTTNKEANVPISEIGNFLTTRKYEASTSAPESKIEATTKKETEATTKKEIEAVTMSKEVKEVKGDLQSAKIESTTVKSNKIFIDVTTIMDVEQKEPESTTVKEYEITEEPPFPDPDSYPDTDNASPKPFSFVRFVKNLIEFKLRLGMNILQTTTENIARYLRGVETNLRTAAKASAYANH